MFLNVYLLKQANYEHAECVDDGKGQIYLLLHTFINEIRFVCGNSINLCAAVQTTIRNALNLNIHLLKIHKHYSYS